MNHEQADETYLGDGLYASYDGYHVWLKSGDGRRVYNQVALEPNVIYDFIAYIGRLYNKKITVESI